MPYFPKKLHLVGLFLAQKGNLMLFPLHQTFEKIEDSKSTITDIVKEFTSKKNGIELPPQVIVIPLKFDSLVPLKKEYWEGEHEAYDYDERVHNFIEFHKNPTFYKYLITPGDYDEINDKFSLDAAIPIKLNSEEKDLKNFMFHSDFPVNELASNSAFYIPLKPLRYNYLTNKVDRPKRSKNLKDKQNSN